MQYEGGAYVPTVFAAVGSMFDGSFDYTSQGAYAT
jgi:hypothetical protein